MFATRLGQSNFEVRIKYFLTVCKITRPLGRVFRNQFFLAYLCNSVSENVKLDRYIKYTYTVYTIHTTYYILAVCVPALYAHSLRCWLRHFAVSDFKVSAGARFIMIGSRHIFISRILPKNIIFGGQTKYNNTIIEMQELFMVFRAFKIIKLSSCFAQTKKMILALKNTADSKKI